ncbi:DUF4831 family protein [uncultured Bacteroides sp.]|uniref:DUF4831 family protein n=1 Tax=uncultured Bacteroides sp. TaxID=162156 RepID=UPI002AA8BF68|nr:DUF4831 family protein [uncultured Bacteroides sp.]
MKRSILLLGLFLSAVAYPQTKVTLGITHGKDFGVTYTLPKTEIEVEVRATKITYMPGEFGKYAERYLHLTDVSIDPEEYWELTSVKAQPIGVPNSERTYFVKMKDKTVAPLIELTDDGIVKSINMPVSAKRAPITKAPLTKQKQQLNPRDFLTEEILTATSTAKMAELVAKEIYNIRESKNALLRGQADNMPKDGEQLKLMLDNLDEQESAMTAMFSGTKNKEEKVYTIRLVPDKEFKNEVAFRFSKKLGVVASTDLAGEPIYFNLIDLKTINIPTQEDKKKELDGVAYNVPGKARITILQDKKPLFEGEFPITQFGTVEYLAPALFDKKSTIKVLFNSTTGGLIKVDREEEDK